MKIQCLHLTLALALAPLMLSSMAGCATLSSSGDGLSDDAHEQASEIDTDPVLIRARRDGEDTVTEYLDAEEVFQRAFQDFQARRYEDALDNYQLILEYFASTRFHLPSLYNGGLALEQLERWQDASELYRKILDQYPDSNEALNARFRLANALHELGEFHAADELLTQVLLEDHKLEHFDRVEAHVRRGFALLELEKWSDADQSFENVLELNRRADPDEQLRDNSHFMVQTYFGIGRANHGRMNTIELVLPPDRMTVDLETKADHHQRAQVYYIRALREHHPYWSVAAGYMIGRLYQDFYLTIFTAEIPDGLSDMELSVYFEELRNKTRVLMDRALNVYERNLSFSRRIHQSPDADAWVDATALHLSRMRAFLDDPLVQQRAEELVISGGNLEDLWDPIYYARHSTKNALEEARQAIITTAGSEPGS